MLAWSVSDTWAGPQPMREEITCVPSALIGWRFFAWYETMRFYHIVYTLVTWSKSIHKREPIFLTSASGNMRTSLANERRITYQMSSLNSWNNSHVTCNRNRSRSRSSRINESITIAISHYFIYNFKIHCPLGEVMIKALLQTHYTEYTGPQPMREEITCVPSALIGWRFFAWYETMRFYHIVYTLVTWSKSIHKREPIF